MLSSVWRGMRAAKASRCFRPSSSAAAASGSWQASSVSKPAWPSTWSSPGACTIWHPRVAPIRRTDVIECAVGPYHLREGFLVHWYRSSKKKKRDERDRNERIDRAMERLQALDLKRMRGPKTEAAIRSRVDEILAQHRAEEWVTVDIKWDKVEYFKAVTRGKPTADTSFRRIVKKEPRLHVK